MALLLGGNQYLYRLLLSVVAALIWLLPIHLSPLLEVYRPASLLLFVLGLVAALLLLLQMGYSYIVTHPEYGHILAECISPRDPSFAINETTLQMLGLSINP
jgi:hypothetical protein